MQIVHKSLIDFIKIKSARVSKERDEYFVNEIKKYKHNLFRIAKSILHNDTDAEDAVGETIYKAYSKLDSLRSLNSFKPWIMKILVNECYVTAKRQSRVDYLDKMENGVDRVQGSTQISSPGLWAIVYQLEQEFSTRARQKLKRLFESEGGYFDESI